MMFGGSRIKGVGAEVVCALEEGKPQRWHDDMNEPFFLADRAITLGSCKLFEQNAIADCATVTTAGKRGEFGHNLSEIS